MRLIICVLMTMITTGSASESQRVRFGPGVCGPIDPVYIKGATETGGQPFPRRTAEVGQSSRIIEASFLPDMILWASSDSENSYSISFDPTVKRVMFCRTVAGAIGLLFYGLVQVSDERYLLQVIPDDTFSPATTRLLGDQLHELLGPSASIDIETVPFLTPAPSGKFRLSQTLRR